MEIDIGSILGNAVLAAAVYTLLNSQLSYLKGLIEAREKRIVELEDEIEKANDAHKKDLRSWAGINQGAAGIEEDTRRFITAEKQRKLREEWEKRQANLSDGD